MALLPILMKEILDDIVYPTLTRGPWRSGSGYLRQWRHVPYGDSGVLNIDNNNEFKVNLDVQQFKPDEISVKMQNDFLIVKGEHEERQDKHGFISRQFEHRYKLPANVDLEKIKSSLSSDGVLTLHAPKKIEEGSGERTIPIEATNKPAIKQQSNSNENQME